ncbi:MAG: rod shape-determining protein MreD [Lactobacillus sp.]
MRIFHQWVLALALYFALSCEGLVSVYIQHLAIHGFIAPVFVLPIAVMIINLIDDLNVQEYWLALGAGVIADLYFWGIIGIYTVFLPVSVWCCHRLARILPDFWLFRWIVVLVGTSCLTVYIWLILNFMDLASISVISLWQNLFGNLIMSSVLFGCTYWLWVWLSQSYPFLVDLDAYRK